MTSITKIANALNVSPMTVSRALNPEFEHKYPSARKKAECIREMARKLGYRPNAAAQNMRARCVDNIALILSTQASRSILPESIMAGIFKGLYHTKHHLIMAPVEDADISSPEYVPNILKVWTSGGILINYNSLIPPRMLELMEDFASPYIWLNSKHASNCVYINDMAVGVSVTRHLLGRGLTRIAYADYFTRRTEDPWHYSGIDRFQGYCKAMKRAGFASRRLDMEVLNEKVEFEDAIRCTQAWARSRDCPQAVVCYNARTAVAIHTGLASLGRRSSTPPVVAVVNDTEQWEFAGRSVTQLIPVSEMARQGVKLLLKQMEDGPERTPPLALAPGKIFEGEGITH